jgi:choline dehydrogenase-like flavoprotein
MKTPSLSFLYRDAVRKSESLEVLLGHTAVGFQFDGPRIASLRVRRPDGSIGTLDGRDFVVCAGTIENTRLLLTSGIDDPGCPWKGNDNVGRYFQDHLGAKIAIIRPTDLAAFFRIFSSIHWCGQKFQPKLRLEQRLVKERGILSTQAMISFEGSVSENLLFLRQFLKAAVFSRSFDGIASIPRTLAGCALYLPPLMWTYIKDNRIFVPSNAKITIKVQSEQRSRPESRIMIDGSVRDRFGLPTVILDWRVGDEELRSIREFLFLCDAALREAGLGTVEVNPTLEALDPRALDLFRDTNHPAGGTIMGDSEADGVVDRDLRVFGSENCYVLGASVFPTSSNANVTFTAMALSLRLADRMVDPNASPRQD